MDRQTLATLIQEGSRLVSGLMHTYGVRRPKVELITPKITGSGQDQERVTTDETVQYQRREIAKELILLEGHLQQGCRINSKPCNCCEKHPIKLEGLAQETAGMTPEPVFRELADWIKTISPMTSEAAAASGKYDAEYPGLAMRAREFRKAIMPVEMIKEVANGPKQLPATTEEGH